MNLSTRIRTNGGLSPDPAASPEATGRPNTIVENARREFASAFGDLARGKRNWQIAAFSFAAIAIVEGLTAFRLANSAHPVPYLVSVDRLGGLTPIGAAEQLRTVDARLIASQLADFIRSVRTVLPATASTAQADLLRRGYALAAPAGAGFLNQYFGDPAHDPRAIGSRIARDVRVTSALHVPEPQPASRVKSARQPQTWRLQWVETDRPIGLLDLGDSTSVAAWEGYITLEIVPPRTVESIQDNPLGVRITSISWTRIAGQLVPRDSVNTFVGSSHDGGIR